MFHGCLAPTVEVCRDNFKAWYLTYLDDLVIPHNEKNIDIDNGCDQTIVNNTYSLVQTFTGTYINMGGALSTMSSSNLEIVNDVFTIAILEDGSKIILKINQALFDLDPGQTEALLQPHQACSFGVIVDDCAKWHLAPNATPDGQYLKVGDTTVPLYFDG